jgi:phospholipase/carboxylesterase
MTSFTPPIVVTAGSRDPAAPLVVLLHGRGSNEQEIAGLAEHLPAALAYAAVRAPIAEGGGYAWFANRGIGRPVAESLRDTMDWFRAWLDDTAPAGRPVVLIGFSGGAAFAGGLLLDHPDRYAGGAVLYGTLPFDAGVATTPGRLAGVPVFAAQGDHDTVIPRELLDRTWTYLHGGSGARATGRRDPVGHGLAPDALVALRDWLANIVAPAAAGAINTTTGLQSRADVTTATPERYAKQLVSHLGRKIEFRTDGPASVAGIGDGTGTVIVGDGQLTLLANGPDEEALTLVEHVLGSHLERFGARNELLVTWQRAAPAGRRR